MLKSRGILVPSKRTKIQLLSYFRRKLNKTKVNIKAMFFFIFFNHSVGSCLNEIEVSKHRHPITKLLKVKLVG